MSDAGKADTSDGVFSDEERAAMKERAREVKSARRKGAGKADDEAAVLEKIAGMPDADRALAEAFHATVVAAAPELAPKLWYGMPAYAKDGKVLCFFQDAAKFTTRYATFGFNDVATVDDGTMWPTAYALTEWTEENEAMISTLLKRAVRE